ncbi:MAG: M16 family metallopeptidase, partial [Chitinophagaceae bacterium]
MKSFINKSLIAIACLPFFAQAQLDRTNPPKPLPAGVIKITDPATFVLPNGLKVFVVTSKKLPKVSATLTLDIGALKEGDKAGYVDMAGQMMMRGTKTKSKAEIDEAIDLLGASVFAGSSSVFGSSLTANFDKVMELMADITFNPAFNADELEKIRKQALSGLEQQKESPDAIASNVSKALAYGLNHPYGEIETVETVNKITINDVKKFYNTYWKPNIGYLVFVGDITTEKARALATKHFSKWAKGVVPKTEVPFPSTNTKPLIAIVDRPQSVQSNISIIAPIALKPGEANVIPASITASILGGGASGRLYKNLREAHGFTYGAYSSISSDKHIGTFSAGASVRNEKTDSAIGEFFSEFNRIRKQPVGEDEVFMVKKELAGSFSRGLERAGTIADFALNVARNNMPKDYYKNYIKNIDAVNVATVQSIANQFIKPNNLIVVVVCNAKQVAEGLEKYGDVQYFDMNGKPTKAPSKGK